MSSNQGYFIVMGIKNYWLYMLFCIIDGAEHLYYLTHI